MIAGRYLDGTRLRLRRLIDGDGGAIEYKLTQKIPSGSVTGAAVQAIVTNMYLSEAEYERLADLPGALVRKTRHYVPPLMIDAYDPPLDGLIVAEAEFDTDEAATAFRPPAYLQAEVTGDPRFTGGRLARASRAEVMSWLGEVGVRAAPAGE